MKTIKYIIPAVLTFLTVTAFSVETNAAQFTGSETSVTNNHWPRHKRVWISGHYKVNRHGRVVWVPGHWRRVRC